MPKELPKTYDPKSVEGRIYSMWVDGGYFKGEVDKNKKPFSIVDPASQCYRPASSWTCL